MTQVIDSVLWHTTTQWSEFDLERRGGALYFAGRRQSEERQTKWNVVDVVVNYDELGVQLSGRVDALTARRRSLIKLDAAVDWTATRLKQLSHLDLLH